MQKPLAANLYNPHEQSKEQLIQRFVVRRKIFRKLFREIKSSDMKYPEQHFLIVGQRGMGKTTLLLRLGYEIENDPDLSSWLSFVVLKEEAYWGVTNLFKLWETVARELENKDHRFSGLFSRMEAAYTENNDYERLIFDILIDALQAHSQKLLLLVDNLAEMFKNFSDTECRRLREILMTCPHLRIIGASAIVMEAFFTYQHAFYEFFKEERLEGLNREETRCLLKKMATSASDQADIDHILEHQQGRIDALRIMTGGVIRTIVLLFEIFIDNQNGNALADLESVLDRVTPLYKHRMDDLSPLQRGVVNAIALNWDAVSIEDIAKKTRIKRAELAPVIDELIKVEIIQRRTSEMQTSLYHIKERFFNIWYLMRVAPQGSKQKVIWLVRFLESWYDKDELINRAKKHMDALCHGEYHPKGAYFLIEALAQTCKLDSDVEHKLISTTRDYLSKKDRSLMEKLALSDKNLFEKGYNYYKKQNFNKSIENFLLIKKKNKTIYHLLGFSYDNLGDHQKAIQYYLQAAENGSVHSLLNLGWMYQIHFKDYEKAEKYYLSGVERDHVHAIVHLAHLYRKCLNDEKNAFKYIQMAERKSSKAFKEGDALALSDIGFYFLELNKYEKAKKYFLMALEKGNPNALAGIVSIYLKLNDLNSVDEYLSEYKNFDIYQCYTPILVFLGGMYSVRLNEHKFAIKILMRAVKNRDTAAMLLLGFIYQEEFDDVNTAKKYFNMAQESNERNSYIPYQLIEFFYQKYSDYKTAEKHYFSFFDKDDPDVLNAVALFYFNKKIYKNKALEYACESVKKQKNIYNSFNLSLIYLWHEKVDEAKKNEKTFILNNGNFDPEINISFYIMFLLAKKYYDHIFELFKDSKLNLKEKLKPLYYALLHLTNDEDKHKMPPELSEPVNDIIEKINQMAVDYA